MSAPSEENGARPPITSSNPTSSQPRSCVICAQRKVRCDKQYPCSRCQRAGIPCVLPSTIRRPPRVRYLLSPPGTDTGTLSTKSTPAGTAVDTILERLNQLEGLVKDLRGELEEARTTSTASVSQPGSQPSGTPSTDSVDVNRSGRIILDESDRVRYVSSGFWSRIDSELDSLKEDTRGGEIDEIEGAFAGGLPQSRSSLSAAEADRTPLDRYSFLLKYNLSIPSNDTSALLPMASQIPFLLEVYAERVHFVTALPHMPSLKKFLQQQRRSGSTNDSSPSEEALVFSVFYAAICSLEDEEVTTSFNVPKNELTLKYRIGLEHALAKADFLNNPSNVLIEALTLFLALARRNESPKFVWMMTGLVVRMAHYLGLQNDGSGSEHITPFQVEMQRRIWSCLCALDMRVTEDQGTELAITHGSYSTRAPSNINDADIWPEMKELPLELPGLTDATFLRLCSETARSMQKMMATGAPATVEDHNRRINDLEEKFDREYFSLIDESLHHTYLAAAGTMRVILGRLTLLAYPPRLYSSPDVTLAPEIRTKLLVAAIEVVEHNHALNSDSSCVPWRWVYQTQQHWHAVVYLLIEICRRLWSPTIERAWIALQSPWLVPHRTQIDQNYSIWAPLRKLMVRARKHREDEIIRLQADPEAAAKIEREDQQQIPVPSSSTTFPMYFEPEMYYKRWRELIRPLAATSIGTLDSTCSTATNNQNTTDLDLHFDSPNNANNVHKMAPLQHDNQPLLPATHNWDTSLSVPEPWLGPGMDLSNYTNLDAFLGTDMEMDPIDVMSTGNAFNFDWNTWFESAKGAF